MTRINPPFETVSGQRIAVLGAGMVGVCAALELQRRGAVVTLIDRKPPGSETSYGNAGVLARSSLIPLNNPGLFRQLPGFLGNRRTGLRYDPLFMVRNMSWALQFLFHAQRSRFQETVQALDSLIRLSIVSHQELLQACGLTSHLSDRGWIFLYRSQDAFDGAAANRDMMDQYDVKTQILSATELADLEPGLAPVFPKSLWIRDSFSIDNPGAVVKGYAKAFVERGGTILDADIQSVSETESTACVHLCGLADVAVDQVAVCLGPWGRPVMERSGFRVTMAYERGYHCHFSGRRADGSNLNLGRPVYDTSGGYVLAPMEQGLRLTTGVELADIDAPQNQRQLTLAEQAARDVIDLGERLEETPWMGRRPTFPDSRPSIGLAPGARRIAVAFGHQHIGFMTGPGTAHVLADILEGKPPAINAVPFSPDRFIRPQSV